MEELKKKKKQYTYQQWKDGQRGTRSTYQQWKEELFRSVQHSMWRMLGIDDIGYYLFLMEHRLHEAVAAASAEPRDLRPAKEWATYYRGWIVAGGLTCALVTPVPPLVLLFSAYVVRKCDANAERLLAWRMSWPSSPQEVRQWGSRWWSRRKR